MNHSLSPHSRCSLLLWWSAAVSEAGMGEWVQPINTDLVRMRKHKYVASKFIFYSMSWILPSHHWHSTPKVRVPVAIKQPLSKLFWSMSDLLPNEFPSPASDHIPPPWLWLVSGVRGWALQLRTSPGQAATTDSNILLCSFLCHPTDSVKYVL